MSRCRAAAALAIAIVAGTTLVAAQTYKAAETFDAVVSIVRDSHFDPAFDRAGWDRTATELRPKALESKTPGELRAVLADMLGRLGLSHFNVVPGTPDTPSQPSDFSGQPGFDVRLVGRQLVVTAVESDTGASVAGVRAGWVLDRIGETPVASFLERIPETTPARIAQVEAWRLAIMRLRGPSGSPLDATFLDAAGTSIRKSIERHAERGAPVTVGSLPTMFVRVSSNLATTPDGKKAGVIGFNVWMTAVDREFQIAMDRFRGADGIVIDLRGNPGGLAAMIMGLSGHFFPERATLGVMSMKQADPLRFNANPRLVSAGGVRVEPYAGPVAILVDSLTGSASESESYIAA